VGVFGQERGRSTIPHLRRSTTLALVNGGTPHPVLVTTTSALHRYVPATAARRGKLGERTLAGNVALPSELGQTVPIALVARPHDTDLYRRMTLVEAY